MDRLEEYSIECMLITDNQAQEDELIKEYERNNMDRLISEKEILKNAFYIKRKECGLIDVVEVDAIKAIPSAEPRWIPVSERLPEDRRPVLVTAYWHETYQVMMGSYFGDGLWWCVPFNNTGKHEQKLHPKAWMPLPSPYEPQESEVNNG